jgi:hypothetical protein
MNNIETISLPELARGVISASDDGSLKSLCCPQAR